MALAADETPEEDKFNPCRGMDAARVDPDPPRADRPVDHKAVAYLLLGTLLSCLIGIFLMSVKFGTDPTQQALGEIDLRGGAGSGRGAGAAGQGDAHAGSRTVAT